MADGTAPLPTAPTDAPATGAAANPCASPLVERQMEALGELVEIGLRIARAIDRQVGEAGEGAKGLAELNAAAMTYGRVSRAVRQTILLQTRLTEALDAGRKAAAARAERRAAVTARMAGVVRRAIEAEHGDAERVERLVAEAAERLEQETFGEELERPVQEIIADICEALGLHPDWSGLAREVADIEAFARSAASDAADDDDDGPIEIYWLGEDGRPVRASGPDSS